MKHIELKLIFFGELKKYFTESLTLSVELGTDLSAVVRKLVEIEPDAQNSLAVSQLAIQSAIVHRGFIVSEPHEIILLPPFSGG